MAGLRGALPARLLCAQGFPVLKIPGKEPLAKSCLAGRINGRGAHFRLARRVELRNELCSEAGIGCGRAQQGAERRRIVLEGAGAGLSGWTGEKF